MSRHGGTALARFGVVILAAGFIGADRAPVEKLPREARAIHSSKETRARPIDFVVASLSGVTAASLVDASSGLTLPTPVLSAEVMAIASRTASQSAATNSSEGDYYTGLRAFNRGDKTDAVEIWKRAALEKDDLLAQNRLGMLYRQGRHVLQNFAESYTWHALAVINKNINANQDAPDYADQTRAKAESQAQIEQLKAIMIEDDLDQARRAVVARFERKGARGLFELAQLFESGKAVPKNAVEAYRYYVIAAFLGDADALRARDALVGTLQPAQVASAQRAAAAFRGAAPSAIVPEKASTHLPTNEPPQPAMEDAAKQAALTDPQETAPTPETTIPQEAQPAIPPETSGRTAIVDLARSSDDTAVAQIALRTLGHFKGRADGTFGGRTLRAILSFQRVLGVRRTGQLTEEQFERLLTRAANTEDPVSQLNLGLLYAKGRYVDQSGLDAVRLLKASARQGIAEAYFQLGLIYREGMPGIARDTTLAAFNFREARKRKHPQAGTALRGLES